MLLIGGTTNDALSWDLRLKIVIGAARGLAFLHSSERQVIYRDFKASNILLDSVSKNLPFKILSVKSQFLTIDLPGIVVGKLSSFVEL